MPRIRLSCDAVLGLVLVFLCVGPGGARAAFAYPGEEVAGPSPRAGAAGLPPLHAAIAAGDLARAKKLLGGASPLEPQVDVLATDREGWTALHHAVGTTEAVPAIKLLLEAAKTRGLQQGTSIFGGPTLSLTARLLETRDRLGRTALHLAASRDSYRVATLLGAGADPNATSRDGTTPIHIAVVANMSYVVQDLLKAGADPSIRNAKGHSAIDLCPSSPLQPMLREAADVAKPARDTKGVKACWHAFLKAVRDRDDAAMRAQMTETEMESGPARFPRWTSFEVGEIGVRGDRAEAFARVRYGPSSAAADPFYELEASLVRTDATWRIEDVRRRAVSTDELARERETGSDR